MPEQRKLVQWALTLRRIRVSLTCDQFVHSGYRHWGTHRQLERFYTESGTKVRYRAT